MTKLEKLYELARNNNKEAIDELFKLNYKYIENKAQFIYNSISDKLKDFYTELPNSLIDYDDILQDLSIKSYQLIIKYFSTNNKVMLSTYISHMLKSYINTTISSKSKEIIKLLKSDNNIGNQYIDEDKNLIFELIDLISRNPKFNNHYNFIIDIFNRYDYQELSKKYNIHIRGMSVKMKTISNLYDKSIKNEDKLVNYIKEDLVKQLQNGDLYKLSYFKNKIIFILHDVYIFLKDNYYLDYHTVKNEFIKLLCIYLNRSKDNINSNTNIDNYINNILLSTKDSYLKNKMKELDYIKSCNYNKYFISNQEINSNEALELIKRGTIYQIYPYCNLINMIIEEICIKTNVEKRKVKSSIKSIINNFIINYFKNNEFNISEFNNSFKEKILSILVKKENVLVKK